MKADGVYVRELNRRRVGDEKATGDTVNKLESDENVRSRSIKRTK